ncbi:MAG: hypothetical protein HY296_00585 [Thaumarchaeota archaeon]|nr:hypothetical protein [Nitrososphaerota archaeon]
MLIIALLKGVPARTTQVAQVGGVLNREAMDLVLNPHDSKAIEAADFLKRRVGGKIVALSMGPDMKLIPLMKPLFDAEVLGVDEEYVLSDRKMAGSDTLATSYAVSLGVRNVVKRHVDAIDKLTAQVKKAGYSDSVRSLAAELYGANLLPNSVYSEIPAITDSVVQRFIRGETTAGEAIRSLENEKEKLSRYIVVSGVKTTDGETGSVGPQVAEGLSELTGRTVPHATYVEDFDIEPSSLAVVSQRRIGQLSQKLEMELPALLTISPDYRPREPVASGQEEARRNSYRGKSLQASKWTAEDLGADPKRLGLAGSPTIVGSGVEVGKPPVQKALGRSIVFITKNPKVEFGGKDYGPFEKGDLADGLPEGVLAGLKADGALGVFSYEMLVEEIFA